MKFFISRAHSRITYPKEAYLDKFSVAYYINLSTLEEFIDFLDTNPGAKYWGKRNHWEYLGACVPEIHLEA